jgi:hypothetical protein
MLRYRWLKILGIFATVVIAFIAIKAVYRATTFKPQSIFEVPFRERSHSKFDEDVRVTAAVLSAKESRQVFGVNLAGKGIQPVWVKIENHDTTPYWLLSSGLDPDYFSPLESAYTFHSKFTPATNKKIDEQFRVMSFRNPIVPHAAVTGFLYVNLDEGIKVVDIDLLGNNKSKFFTFFVQVPGIKADYQEVDFENLYSKKELVDFDDNELRAALENLPDSTTNADGTRKGDPLNLVVIGTREDISAAFVRRGWLPAEQTYSKAIWKTIKSFLLGSRYRYSPVSPLYLYGRQQDMAGQKPRHTVHERNHLRLWLSPMRYAGKPVWVGQISRDIGVRFTLKVWPPVTHKIDPDIDGAMFALIEDLMYSQQLAKTGFVKGVEAATRSKPRHNLTGDPYFTSGYRVVLVLDRRPFSFEEIQSFKWESPISDRIKRLSTTSQPDFDEQRKLH